MPPTKGLFSRRKPSTDDAFGPTQFHSSSRSHSEDGPSDAPGIRIETPSSNGRVAMSLLNSLPSSGKQKRAQINTTSTTSKATPIVTASLGNNGGSTLVFAPASNRRVVSTNSSQSYINQTNTGHHHHQSYNASSSALSASYLSQAPTNGTTASERPKKTSILPARSKSDVNKLTTFQRITGKRKPSEKEKEKERERAEKEQQHHLQRERTERDTKQQSQSQHQQHFVDSYNGSGSSFDQGERLYNSLPSRQPRHQQHYQPQSGLRQDTTQIYSEPDLKPPHSAGSTIASDKDIPPTPPTKSPVNEDFEEVPPPVPAHTVPLPTSPLSYSIPIGENSRPPIISPLDFEFETVHPLVLEIPKIDSASTTPPDSPPQRTRSDSLPSGDLGVMPAYQPSFPPVRFDPSYDWTIHGNKQTTNNKPPSPITPTKPAPEGIGLGIGIPIMQSENLERVLRSSSSNLLNPPTSSNDSLVMENDLLRKALLQKNEVIKSLDPARIMGKNDGSKNEATRASQVLYRRVEALEQALTSKDGAYKRAQERAKELKEAHQDLVETIKASHAKELARLKTQIHKLENPTLVLSSNFDGLGINFDDGPGLGKEEGLRGMLDDLDGLRGQTQRMEKLIAQRTYEMDKSNGKSSKSLSPFSLPPLPQRAGSAPTNGKFLPDSTFKQIEELRRQLNEETRRRKEAERKLEEAAARARADMESALMENERIREAENSKHLLELRRTIEEERKLQEGSKRELVDAAELVEQLRRDRDELVEHEERMRQEVTDELTQLRQSYDDLMSRFEETTEEADSLREVVDELSQEVDGGKAEVVELKAERQKLLDKANEIMESLRKEKKRSKHLTLQLQRAQSGSGGSTHLDLEPPITPISPMNPASFADTDAQQLRLLLESKSRELEQMQTEIARNREHLSLFQLDGKNFRKDLKKRDTKISKLQTQISELHVTIEQKDHQIQSLEESLALEKRMMQSSGEGLGSPTDNPGIMAGRVSAIKDENLQLKARLRHYEEEYKSTFEDAASLRRKLETFTAQQAIVLSDLENNVVRLRKEKTELEKSSARKINKLKLMLASASLSMPPKEDQPLSYSALPSDGFFTSQPYPEYPPDTASLSRKPTLEISHPAELPGPVSDSDIPGRTLSGRRRKSESRKKMQTHREHHAQQPPVEKRMSLETPLPSPPPKDIQFNPSYAPVPPAHTSTTTGTGRPGMGGSRHTFGPGSKPPSVKTNSSAGKKERKGSVVSAMSNDGPPKVRRGSVVSDLRGEEDELVIYW